MIRIARHPSCLSAKVSGSLWSAGLGEFRPHGSAGKGKTERATLKLIPLRAVLFRLISAASQQVI